jgi:signal transduction histidine kinase
VVTFQQNEKIFLKDDTGSAMAIFKEDVMLDARFGHSRWLYWRAPKVKTDSKPAEIFLPGERVQVIGFPETHRYSPVLTEVTLAKLGVQQILNPVALTAKGIGEGGLDSSLVTFDGLLRNENTVGANTALALEWQDRTLQVLVPGNESDLSKIVLGSSLRVTGICQIDPAPYAELGLDVGAVRIQARSLEDLKVLAQPSWWTIRRTLALMGGMAFFMLAALIWIKELRRLVGERTVQLSAEIQSRQKTEHHHALEQERARIAKDLHDDLGANLTQIIFLSERVEVARHEGHEVTRWFDLIPATARRTIQSLDEIVWAINPRHDSLESLANYLSQFAQEHLTLARVRCVLHIPMVLPSIPLSAEVRHNLLLTTREALQNAVTHATATEVQLTLKLNEEGVSIAIADNGNGFDPDSFSSDGNGLQNMRRRLQDIGGRLEINSRPGQGTTILLFVPEAVLHGRVIGGNGVSSQES